jgi:hypothetical protein
MSEIIEINVALIDGRRYDPRSKHSLLTCTKYIHPAQRSCPRRETRQMSVGGQRHRHATAPEAQAAEGQGKRHVEK